MNLCSCALVRARFDASARVCVCVCMCVCSCAHFSNVHECALLEAFRTYSKVIKCPPAAHKLAGAFWALHSSACATTVRLTCAAVPCPTWSALACAQADCCCTLPCMFATWPWPHLLAFSSPF